MSEPVERWRFEFESLPNDPQPMVIRVRALLKYALRAQRLKLVGYAPGAVLPEPPEELAITEAEA